MALTDLVQMQNDVKADNDAMRSPASVPYQLALPRNAAIVAQQQNQKTPEPPSLGNLPLLSGMGGNEAPPNLPALRPLVTSPRQQQEDALQSKISAYENPGAPKTGFWHELGKVAARIGNVAGDVFAPGAMALTPGTDLYNLRQQESHVNELSNLQKQDTEEKTAAAQQAHDYASAAQATAEAGEAPFREQLEQAQSYRALHPLATSDFELWHQQNPNGTAEQYQGMLQKPISQEQADSMNKVWNATAQKYGLPTNQFIAGMPAADANTLATSLNNVVGRNIGQQNLNIKLDNQEKSLPLLIPDGKGNFTLQYVGNGQTVAPGSMTASGMSGLNVSNDKGQQKLIDAANDADETLAEARQLAADHTATNDYALLMSFIGMTKPESLGKLRLNNNEIRLVTGTRSSLGDLEALGNKIANGEMLTDDQHKQMLETMQTLVQAAHRRASASTWQAPADAPAAPKEDNKVLKDGNGNIVARSSGGKWVQP